MLLTALVFRLETAASHHVGRVIGAQVEHFERVSLTPGDGLTRIDRRGNDLHAMRVHELVKHVAKGEVCTVQAQLSQKWVMKDELRVALLDATFFRIQIHFARLEVLK